MGAMHYELVITSLNYCILTCKYRRVLKLTTFRKFVKLKNHAEVPPYTVHVHVRARQLQHHSHISPCQTEQMRWCIHQ